MTTLLPEASAGARLLDKIMSGWLNEVISAHTPVIGATRISNLYLATGHGTLGWTMAAGTGRVMADLVSGRKPDIDLAKEQLGWQPTIDLTEGLKRTIAYFKTKI